MHILRTLPALIARIPTAHIVRPVRRRPTAVIVQPLTAAPMLTLPPLVLKPEGHGTARPALCRTRQATTTSRTVLWRVWDNFSKRYSVCPENKTKLCIS